MVKKIIIICGPSGAGKTTLVKELVKSYPEIKPVVTYTTRPPRPGEVDGVDYHFVDDETVEKMNHNNEFIELDYFCSKNYGTSQESITKLIQSKENVVPLVVMTVEGAARMKGFLPVGSAAMATILILPPSLKEAWGRVRLREKLKNSEIDRRVRADFNQMGLIGNHWFLFDHVMVNRNEKDAVQTLKEIYGALID